MAIQERQSSGSVGGVVDTTAFHRAIASSEENPSPIKEKHRYKRFWIDEDSLASIFPDFTYTVPSDEKDNEHYYTSYRFKLRDGSVYSQTEDGFTSNEMNELMAEAQKNGKVSFTNFHRHKRLKENWGAISAFVPIDYSIPDERYVFAYSQKADNTWVPATVSAFEVSVPMKDETEKKFIFVNLETADPTKPHPYLKSSQPPFKGFAVLVVNNKGEPVAGGINAISHWGGGIDILRPVL